MAETAIVILNFNGESFLRQFLPGVVQYRGEAEVIVVDNCSTDQSVEYINQAALDVRLIQFDQNYGFTGGYNKALQLIDHEFSILLNSDVEVTENWIEPIISFMKVHEDVSACQPKILSYHEKDRFEYAGAAGGFVDLLGFPFCRGRIFENLELDQNQYQSNLEVFWATGACMFVRTKDFLDAGGFDEDFFAHMEEIDLCWRFHIMGKKVYCIPLSTVYHVGGGTLSKVNPRKTYLNFRNNLTMLIKNDSIGNLIWKLPLKFGLDWVAAFKFWIDNSFAHFWAVIRAHFYFITHLFTNFKKRKQVIVLKKSNVSKLYPGLITMEYFIIGNKTYSSLKK